MTRLPMFRRLILLTLVLLGLAGCAAGREPHDPMEPWNRKVMAFNDQVDALALKPLAIVYSENCWPSSRPNPPARPIPKRRAS